jgi:hypothetical protein
MQRGRDPPAHGVHGALQHALLCCSQPRSQALLWPKIAPLQDLEILLCRAYSGRTDPQRHHLSAHNKLRQRPKQQTWMKVSARGPQVLWRQDTAAALFQGAWVPW